MEQLNELLIARRQKLMNEVNAINVLLNGHAPEEEPVSNVKVLKPKVKLGGG